LGNAYVLQRQVVADYIRYTRDYGVTLSIKDFYDIFYRRRADPKVKIPKSMEMAFAHRATTLSEKSRRSLTSSAAKQATKFEQELFKQKKRLADAERTLETKTTKAAVESQRIATTR